AGESKAAISSWQGKGECPRTPILPDRGERRKVVARRHGLALAPSVTTQGCSRLPRGTSGAGRVSTQLEVPSGRWDLLHAPPSGRWELLVRLFLFVALHFFFLFLLIFLAGGGILRGEFFLEGGDLFVELLLLFLQIAHNLAELLHF